jgi:glycosyltransferase involved in cell wall biosynthesis
LQELHATQRFDLVEFPEWQALGFRSVQARRAGVAFTDVPFIVTLHGSSQWRREASHHFMDHPDDLETDFAERYAFENADFQAASSPALLDHARTWGWTVRPGARVIPHGLSTRPDVAIPSGELATAYRALLDDATCVPGVGCTPPQAFAQPLVTIAIPYFNLGPYLADALASIAAQTYRNLEVLVIDDGSTDPDALRVFEEQRQLYPHFRFLSQDNAGIGGTRNRGLREACGELYVPMDADNAAFPHMVEHLVRGITRNPDLAAMTCYFLAFEETADLERGDYLYAYKPAGGPRVMASFKNVYGDATAIFRTAAFRAVGGYEIDRDTSFEDWEAFVKLVNAGHQIDVVPDFLFGYRHRESGFSRVTKAFPNHQRVLRQVFRAEDLPVADKVALWSALVSFQKRLTELDHANRGLNVRLGALRYRFADALSALLGTVPFAKGAIKGVLRSTLSAWRYMMRVPGEEGRSSRLAVERAADAPHHPAENLS